MTTTKNIMLIGKGFFWLSFLLGNICLFGYILTQNLDFASYGFGLLIYGSLANIAALMGLFVFGSLKPAFENACVKASGIIALNIPVALIYAAIGLRII